MAKEWWDGLSRLLEQRASLFGILRVTAPLRKLYHPIVEEIRFDHGRKFLFFSMEMSRDASQSHERIRGVMIRYKLLQM